MRYLLIILIITSVTTIHGKAKKGIKGRVIISSSPIMMQVDTTKGKNDTLTFDAVNRTKNLSQTNQKAKISLGEKFTYEVTWGFITAGWSEIITDDILHNYKGRDCYKISSIATSSKKVDFVGQSVRDTSYVLYDKETHRPLYFDKIIHEGSYHRKRNLQFDHKNQTALYNGKKIIRISRDTEDIIGSIFMIRNSELIVGKSKILDVIDDGKFYSLKTKIREKELIDVPLGEYKTIKVEPILKSDGIFKNEGKLWVWFTDDKRRIPVMLQAKIVLGSVKVKMTEYVEGKE